MRKPIRIKDIAAKAQVSTGTVDRVIHNRGNVSPDVRERVKKVIEELGYQRNILASTLAYNKQARVICLLPESDSDLFWAQTHDGIQKAIKSVHHFGLMVDPMFFDFEQPSSFKETANKALEAKPDGIVFPPIFSKESLWFADQCKQRNIPFVIINTNLEGVEPVCYLGQDSFQSGILGAKLLNLGQKGEKVFCILNLDYRTKSAQHLLKKENGFRAYFDGLGEAEVRIFRKDFHQFNDAEKLKKFLLNLLDSYPNLKGIFVTNSRAFKVLDCMGELLQRKSISIVGYDLIAPNIKYLKQNRINFLINQHPYDQGFKAVHNLFRYLIRKEEIEKTQYLRLDVVLKENFHYHVDESSLEAADQVIL